VEGLRFGIDHSGGEQIVEGCLGVLGTEHKTRKIGFMMQGGMIRGLGF
jgi:glutamate synthase domain-containing protein 3